jgi:hypothetical protein
MRGKPKTLPLASLALLSLVMLAMLPGSAKALIDAAERDKCLKDLGTCIVSCSKKAKECGAHGSADYKQCKEDCDKICELKEQDCLRDADKSAPVPFKPKVQPKAQPGGAEQPGSESPNVKPKGGIER